MKTSFAANRLRRWFAGPFWLGLALHATAQPATYIYDRSGNPTAVTPGAAGAPTITTPPQAELIQPNSLATFSVNATGIGLSYQWLSNGVPIPGATGDSLVLANLALNGTNLGNFSVIVSNASGSVTSTPVPLWSDVNGNGIPDWWEMKYFGNLNQTADGDYDKDGVDNLHEYWEGTDPTNPHSYDPRLYIQQANLGSVVASPDLPYYVMGQLVTLTAMPDPGQSFIGWGGSAVGAKPVISLIMNSNSTVTASFGLPLAVALDNTDLTWTTGGDVPWYGQTQDSEDGLGAARSGAIVGGQQSWLQGLTANLTQTMRLSFWWNVSSQPPDALAFAIDGTNAAASIAGPEVGWQQFERNLPPGVHTLLWTYTKQSNDNPTSIPFADAAWVDEVTLTGATSFAPMLGIQNAGPNAVLLYWPGSSTAFQLQQTAELLPANWVSTTNSVNLVNGTNQVMVAPAEQSQFYRLAPQ